MKNMSSKKVRIMAALRLNISSGTPSVSEVWRKIKKIKAVPSSIQYLNQTALLRKSSDMNFISPRSVQLDESAHPGPD